MLLTRSRTYVRDGKPETEANERLESNSAEIRENRLRNNDRVRQADYYLGRFPWGQPPNCALRRY